MRPRLLVHQVQPPRQPETSHINQHQHRVAQPRRIVLPVGPLSKGCLVELEAVAELAEG